jgi:hypothetical protein
VSVKRQDLEGGVKEPACLMARHDSINPLKQEFNLNNIYKFSSYLAGNTLLFYYKDKLVKAVWGKIIPDFFLRIIRNS